MTDVCLFEEKDCDDSGSLAFVQQFWPIPLTADEADLLLWETTCYPFGSMEKVGQQLAESYVTSKGDVAQAVNDAYALISRLVTEYNRDRGDII